MTIYIDVVLILNFVIDMLLIIGVDMLLKRHTKFRKIVISSLIGSLSTLLLFVIKGSLWMFMYKLVISVFLVIIAFGYKGFDYFKENLFWLYIISIILDLLFAIALFVFGKNKFVSLLYNKVF